MTLSLSSARRLEAVMFRSWPAHRYFFDGAWLIRLTSNFGIRRLNSVNSLDPSDSRDIPDRFARTSDLFASADRRLIFRMTPLSSVSLNEFLDSLHWTTFDESLVMSLPLDSVSSVSPPFLATNDTDRWIDNAISLGAFLGSDKAGLSDLISRAGDVGLFLDESAGEICAVGMSVMYEGHVGLFGITTHPDHRRHGYAKRMVEQALSWAKMRRARTAWLQVLGANSAAVSLYEGFGFCEQYRYRYRVAPD